MYIGNNAAERARWAVMWIYADKRGQRKVFRKDFKDDIASAEELYRKALKASKPYATLACVNMGFPPPMELRPRVERKKGRDKRTRKVRVVSIVVEPLKELNAQGIVWCPYCRAKRKFIFRPMANAVGVRFSDPRYVCPICGISERDHNFRKWNPYAALHMSSAVSSRVRQPRSSTKRRRRRRP